MKLHPRTLVVQNAEINFLDITIKFRETNDLTLIEWLQILQKEQDRVLKSMLRQERHPDDPSQPADAE